MQLVAVFVFIVVFNRLNEAKCEQMHQNVSAQQYEIWGDLGRSKVILGSGKTKYAIPFIKRTVEISYPNVSVSCIN